MGLGGQTPADALDLMLERFSEMAAERDFRLASFNVSIPLIQPQRIRVGAIDCREWVSHESLVEIESTDELCTTAILGAVREDDQDAGRSPGREGWGRGCASSSRPEIVAAGDPSAD